MSDFETGLQCAIRQEFPQAQHKGCFFHHCEALFRHVQQLGLVTLYRESPEIRMSIRQVMALGFLPPGRVHDMFQNIRNAGNPNLAPFLDYYKTYWLDTVKPQRFSVYDCDIRTNNNLESWHSGFNRLVGKLHPNLFELMNSFQIEQESNEQLLLQLAIGKTVTHTNRKYSRLNKQIETIRLRYAKGELDDNMFTKSIGYCLADMLKGAPQCGIADALNAQGASTLEPPIAPILEQAGPALGANLALIPIGQSLIAQGASTLEPQIAPILEQAGPNLRSNLAQIPIAASSNLQGATSIDSDEEMALLCAPLNSKKRRKVKPQRKSKKKHPPISDSTLLQPLEDWRTALASAISTINPLDYEAENDADYLAQIGLTFSTADS